MPPQQFRSNVRTTLALGVIVGGGTFALVRLWPSQSPDTRVRPLIDQRAAELLAEATRFEMVAAPDQAAQRLISQLRTEDAPADLTGLAELCAERLTLFQSADYDAYRDHVAAIIGSSVSHGERVRGLWEDMARPFSRATYAVESAFLRPRIPDARMVGGRLRTFRNPVYEGAIGSTSPEEIWEVWIPVELAGRNGLRVFWIQAFTKGRSGRWVPYESAIFDPTDAGQALIPTPWS